MRDNTEPVGGLLSGPPGVVGWWGGGDAFELDPCGLFRFSQIKYSRI